MDTPGADSAWHVLDAAPDGVVIATEMGDIAFVSEQAAVMLGYDRTELLGQPVELLLPEEVRRVHRAHRTRYRAEPTSRPMGVGMQLRARRADGSEFPVEISLKPLHREGRLYVVAALRDVTDRVAAEQHLRRVLLTLDSTSDGVFIFDSHSLRFSYVNEGAVGMTGYSADDLLTMTPLHLNPQSSEPEYREFVGALTAEPDRTLTRESPLLRKDGSEVVVEHTFRCAPAGDGGSRWVITLARDITERLEAAAELQRSQEALQAAERVLAVAEDRERIARDLHDKVIQRLFAAGLNLQAVIGVSDERVRPRLEGTIDTLDETIRELRQAIFSLQGSESATGGLRGRIIDVVTDAAAALGFEPRLQFDGHVESIGEHISAHLIPALREMLSNVAKHARARSAHVTISAGDEVVLEVVDDGVGLSGQPPSQGNGLGNLASRARELGGTFEAIAGDGGGTRSRWCVPSRVTADVDVVH